MPPSSRSSSSHASSSSSRSSSFRSSSGSRSFSSSSSRSSSSYSRSSSGPSKRSTSSHSSSYSSYTPSKSTSKSRMATPQRTRINQPAGYMLGGVLAPRRYYGRRHDYIYYPSAWTDSATGKTYREGYYDENGQYYDNVAFRENGKYQNVLCHCPYCGTDTVLNLDNMEGATQELKCPNCTGQMEIKSELDEVISETEQDSFHRNTDNAVSIEEKKKKRKNTAIIIASILALLLVRGAVRNSIRNRLEQAIEPQVQAVQVVENNNTSNVDDLQLLPGIQITEGKPVYLELQQDGYHVVSDPIRADKILYWNSAYDTWYDEYVDAYVVYNNDVSPATWQYWVEGISSDFGDYGWMEHDDEGWWIETSQNNWIKLPSGYDTSRLWSIANG